MSKNGKRRLKELQEEWTRERQKIVQEAEVKEELEPDIIESLHLKIQRLQTYRTNAYKVSMEDEQYNDRIYFGGKVDAYDIAIAAMIQVLPESERERYSGPPRVIRVHAKADEEA